MSPLDEFASGAWRSTVIRSGIPPNMTAYALRDGAYVHVAMGSLVDDPTIRPTEHIFVGSKAPWFEIADDLPQSEEY